jgi:DnaD/phage-associated family protein
MEKNEEIRSLFATCQAILGKDFNTHDHNNIIFLKSYYKFGNEFIMLLLAHCKEIDKANWQYIRKTAKNLYDEGIDTYARLEEHFADRKNKTTLEYKIRKLFDIGGREFSKAEKEKIDRWTSAQLDIDFIRLAYDITVDKTGKISLAYCAKIIENWLSCGIKTVKEAQESENQRKMAVKSSSFNTDDFFEAALNRSYKKKGGE